MCSYLHVYTHWMPCHNASDWQTSAFPYDFSVGWDHDHTDEKLIKSIAAARIDALPLGFAVSSTPTRPSPAFPFTTQPSHHANLSCASDLLGHLQKKITTFGSSAHLSRARSRARLLVEPDEERGGSRGVQVPIYDASGWRFDSALGKRKRKSLFPCAHLAHRLTSIATVYAQRGSVTQVFPDPAQLAHCTLAISSHSHRFMVSTNGEHVC